MPNLPGSLMQAMHDRHCGTPAERVGVLLIDEQPRSVQQIVNAAANIMNQPNVHRPLPPTPPDVQWATPIILDARRAYFGGNPLPPTPPEVTTIFTQVKEAYRNSPRKTATRLDIQRGLELVGTGRMQELAEELVRRLDQTQENEQKVLAFAARLGIPVWLVELNPAANHPIPPATRESHIGLRVIGPHTRLTKAGINGFQNTNLHNQLQQVAIRHVAVMGRQTNCCVKETSVGGAAPGATGLGYRVMTCMDVITEGQPTWLNRAGVEFYATI
jgi:nicotinamidase-related amidase